MKTPFPVEKKLILDILPYAECIDAILKDVLKPYQKGVYLSGQSVPFLLDGAYYTKFEKVFGEVAHEKPIRDISDVIGDIYDHKHQLVASISIRDKIFTSPTIPLNGIAIIHLYINAIITENSQWLKLKRFRMEDICQRFIRPEYCNDKKVYDTIFDLTYEIKNEVMKFIGDNKFIMHFLKVENHDVIIEKSTDYRIYAWESLFGKMDREEVLDCLLHDSEALVEKILIEQNLVATLSDTAIEDGILGIASEIKAMEEKEKAENIFCISTKR
jgi:hypothetical protein